MAMNVDEFIKTAKEVSEKVVEKITEICNSFTNKTPADPKQENSVEKDKTAEQPPKAE